MKRSFKISFQYKIDVELDCLETENLKFKSQIANELSTLQIKNEIIFYIIPLRESSFFNFLMKY